MFRQQHSTSLRVLRSAASGFLLLLLCAVPGWAESQYQAAILADDPVAYWPLDEQSGDTAFDLVPGSSLHATSPGRASNPHLAQPLTPQLVAAKTFPRTGDQRYAYRIPHELVDPLNPGATGEAFTIEAWIRPTYPIFAQEADKTIVSLDTYGGRSGYFFVHTEDGRLLFRLKRNHTVQSSNARTFPGLITLDTWHHVAVTVTPDADHTAVEFFHNGRAVDAEKDRIDYPMQKSDDGVFRIGDRPGLYGVYFSFEGAMDEVAFYASALDEDRLLTHYGLGSHFTGDRWQVSRGHRILHDRGLQIQAWMEYYLADLPNGLDPETWLDMGTNTQFSYFDPALWADDPQGGWATSILEDGIPRDANGQLTGDVLSASQRQHADRLIGLQIGDEILFDEAAEYVAYTRQQYPDALSYFNFDGHESDSQITTFQLEADPDLLTFSRYLDPKSPPAPMYSTLAQYRRLAAAGNDGSSSRPIPFGQYVRAYNEPSGHRYLGLTGSRIRLSVFSSWTFGAKWISLFKYTGGHVPTHWIHPNVMLFDTWPDRNPTQAYHDYAEALWQSRRLGPALTRLQSTDLRFLPGQTFVDGEAVTNDLPSGLEAWDSAADPWIEGIRVENLGTYNDLLPGDVAIGYFTPLEEDSDGPYYRDELYFMVLNGLIDHLDATGPTEQLITLELDFGDTGINGVERLDRETGNIESMVLRSMGGSRYEMDLRLDGGAADLFKFATGSCFVGIEDCEPTTWAVALGSTLEVQEEGQESSYWFSFFTGPSRRMGQYRNGTGFFFWAEAACIRKTGPHQLIYSAEIQNSSDPDLIGRFVRGFLHDDQDPYQGNDRMILEPPEHSSPVNLGCQHIPQAPEHHLGPLGPYIPELY